MTRTDVNDLTLKVGDKVLIPSYMTYTWIVIGFRDDEALLSKSGPRMHNLRGPLPDEQYRLLGDPACFQVDLRRG